jgi:hypothetical protein
MADSSGGEGTPNTKDSGGVVVDYNVLRAWQLRQLGPDDFDFSKTKGRTISMAPMELTC